MLHKEYILHLRDTVPQYAFMARCLVKHRDNSSFTLSPIYWGLYLYTSLARIKES